MNELEFRTYVIIELRKKGFSKNIYKNFDELLKVLSTLLQICIDNFVKEVSKMEAPHDIFTFINYYDASKKSNQGDIAFKLLCKSIFTLIPKLQLNTNATTIFPYFGKAYLSTLMGMWRKRSIPTHSNGSIHSLLSPKIGLRSA